MASTLRNAASRREVSAPVKTVGLQVPQLERCLFRCIGTIAFLFGAANWVGCVALPVGSEKTFYHELTSTEAEANPVRTTLERARVDLRQRGTTAEISIDADVVEEYAQRRHVRHVTVRQRKRLAIGLFPGAAELVWMPKGALTSAMTVSRAAYDSSPRYCGYYVDRDPGLGEFALEELLVSLGTVGIAPLFYTVDSLVCAPFEPWHCDTHDFIDKEYWKHGIQHGGKRVADASSSPRLRALSELPEELRREIGIRTCFDVRSTGAGIGAHYGLFGFHKYLAVFLELADSESISGTVRKRKKMAVTGPFEVELSIPGVGYSERRLVRAGNTRASFELPGATRDTAIEARVVVREGPHSERGETPDLTRSAVRDLMGQGSRFDVNLRAGGVSAEVRDNTYEVSEIRSLGKGRYVIRVRIVKPDDCNAVVEAVGNEVRRRLREDYANRHPAVRVEEVRDWVHGQNDPDAPSSLVFEGWVFAAHALSEGWQYDSETGRGTVRVRVSEGIPEEQAVQWARENITAIVSDKGIALSAGGVPERSGHFKCLWERFENGILTMGFENVDGPRTIRR